MKMQIEDANANKDAKVDEEKCRRRSKSEWQRANSKFNSKNSSSKD